MSITVDWQTIVRSKASSMLISLYKLSAGSISVSRKFNKRFLN